MPRPSVKKEGAQESLAPLPPLAVHLSVSILVPTLLGLAFAGIGAGAAPGALPLRPLVLLAPAFSAAWSALSSMILEKERASGWGFIRGFILFLILLWILQALFLRFPAAIDFRPRPDSVFLVLQSALGYLLASKLRGSLRSRELFVESLAGLEGARLRESARTDGPLASAAMRDMGGAYASAFAAFILLSACLLVLFIFTGSVPVFLAVALAASLASLIALGALIADFKETQSALCMGLVPDPAQGFARIRLAAACGCCAVILSLLLCPDAPPLSAGAFFDFLSSLLKPVWGASAPPPAADTPALDFDSLVPRSMPELKPLFDLSAFILYMGRFIVAAAAVGFALFLLAPLFSKSLKGFFSARKPGKALRNLLSFLADFFSRLFRAGKPAGSLAPGQRKRIERGFEALARRKKNPEKERETGRMSKAFVGLIARGAELGHPYSIAEVPLEWTASLARDWPASTGEEEGGKRAGTARGEELIEAARIFEEALYSDRLVGKERSERYFDILKRSLSANPSGRAATKSS